MSAPDFILQLNIDNQANPHTFEEGVRLMNTLVLQKCRPKPRAWWRLWTRPPQHRWQDITSSLNTATYTTLDRCIDCGFCVLGSGL